MPAEAIDYLAGKLQIADPSCVVKSTRSGSRRISTKPGRSARALKLQDIAPVEAELAVYVGRRAWATGDSPKAIFAHAVGWHPLPRHQPGQRGHPRQQHIPLAHEGGMSEYRHYADRAEVERAEYEAGL